MKKILVFVALIFCTLLSAQPKAKNIIFMIGDGMGLNQIYAAMAANGGSLNLEKCPIVGLSKTYSASDFITDSAAGGTALATGSKTNNGMIGLAPDSTILLFSSLYYAAQNGKATGIVVTSPLTHATPASFYAHRISRHMYEEIATDLLSADIDVMIGGGRKHFENRTDNQNLSEKFREKGYEVLYSEAEFLASKSDKIFAPLADVDLPKASERGDYLPNAVAKTIEILSQDENGFFLMVEGSQIDYQGHGNNCEEMICEVRDFDKAIGKALEFAEKDGNTLVVITADHETGGLTILDFDDETGKVDCEFSTNGHTGVPVPIFAFGPGAEKFAGIQQNADLCDKVLEILGITAQ